ncbi:MAG: 2'-5' RNA ligase family protein [Chloroflexi bacterium]|nr:2'-5' RNA ligase family protein [Chloroflexota bacterium]
MYLAVVSYPRLPEGAREGIAFIREQYPMLERDPVPPYFTLVSPNNQISEGELIAHVENIAYHFSPIPFMLRCAIPVYDGELTYIYLPPDEGFSKAVFLYNALYTGILEPYLRLDKPYIPRITLGYTEDTRLAKQIADQLNERAFEIRGLIESLGVIGLTDGKFQTLAHFKL